MIPRTIPTWQSLNWQEELSQLINSPEMLFQLLNLDEKYLPAAQKAHELFPLRTTHSYISRIEQGNIHDPLLKQILPIALEHESPSDFTADPLEEHSFTKTKGLIHKYQGRVLLVAASQCAINCRYCFRRHFDYAANTPSRKEWEETLDYIRQANDLEEVILSGGDPLAISDKQFFWLLEQLSSIEHIQRLRIHTRLPIVIPQRITEDFLNKIAAFNQRFQLVMVVHCNHAQEIDAAVGEVLNALSNAGVTMLNQSVLLKGINDKPATLAELSKQLFRYKTLPYYLHALDKVIGAGHFNVEEHQAIQIHRTLLTLLPGYLVPKLVKEEPNKKSKTPL